MKNSTFKTPTYEEVIAKKREAQKRALERKKEREATKPRKQLKRRATAKKNTNKRKKLPTVKSMRNKCDKLLTPIVKKNHPYCFLQQSENCAGVTQVAHHHVLKSKCTALRYDLDNLIPLCHACHCLLHSHETYYSSMIVEKKGLAWWRKLEEKRHTFVKADVHFYIENHDRLSKLL